MDLVGGQAAPFPTQASSVPDPMLNRGGQQPGVVVNVTFAGIVSSFGSGEEFGEEVAKSLKKRLEADHVFFRVGTAQASELRGLMLDNQVTANPLTLISSRK